MRTLIEEFGYFVITLIVVSFAVVYLVFGSVIPKLTAYTQKAIPNDNASIISVDYEATLAAIQGK